MKKYKSFKLGSHTIKVIYQKTVAGPDGSPVLGLSEFLHNQILIATEFNGKKIADEVIEHTLYHEAAHFMMYAMNKGDLNNDEAFVDILGGHIAQMTKSLK
jgi:hypothetical protein